MDLPAVVVHGGAGNPRGGAVEDEAPYHESLREALAAARMHPADALSAVEAAVRVLEDAPLFNAGRGSVLTSEGTVETDAAIMCGATLRSGAVAAVTGVRNPISLARGVMESFSFGLKRNEGRPPPRSPLFTFFFVVRSGCTASMYPP